MAARHPHTVLLVAVALLTSLAPFPAAGGTPAPLDEAASPGEGPSPDACGPEGDGVPHTPIEITENVGPEGFVLGHDPVTGEPVYRPGSGVVAGNGTAANPYLIEGWCIPVLPSDEGGLVIHHTDAHVAIRDVELSGPGPARQAWGALGIHLTYAANVAIDDVLVEDLYHPLTSWGILIDESRDIAITDVAIDDVNGRPIDLIHSRNVTIDGARVTDSAKGHAIGLRTSSELAVTNSVIADHPVGIHATSLTHNVTIAHNRIANTSSIGLDLPGTNANVVRANVVTGGEHGIVLRDPPDWWRHSPEQPSRIVANNLQGNANASLTVLGLDDPAHAEDNWWGHATGPSGDVQDACTDAVADGEGTAIVTEAAEVCFDPWLQAPNPEAGPTR